MFQASWHSMIINVCRDYASSGSILRIAIKILRGRISCLNVIQVSNTKQQARNKKFHWTSVISIEVFHKAIARGSTLIRCFNYLGSNYIWSRSLSHRNPNLPMKALFSPQRCSNIIGFVEEVRISTFCYSSLIRLCRTRIGEILLHTERRRQCAGFSFPASRKVILSQVYS